MYLHEILNRASYRKQVFASVPLSASGMIHLHKDFKE